MKHILFKIVIAQFLCTSLWFAGNAVLPHLLQGSGLDLDLLSHLTSSVQFGFIVGTLIFALFSISDRLSPSLLFLGCSVFSAICNLSLIINDIPFDVLLIFRFLTGFFLAGIYPIGMKIASDHFSTDLQKSLGYLVGALVLGTAFPHALPILSFNFEWQYIIYTTSLLSLLGGIIMYKGVPDGPYRQVGHSFSFKSFLTVFENNSFKTAAYGYFGHMWELYTFWAFVPVILQSYANQFPTKQLDVSLFSFLIIAFGSIACVISGKIAFYYDVKKVALFFLICSGICCLISPFLITTPSTTLFLLFMFCWGFVVIADSPLFSTLIAKNALSTYKGSALTLVNCIGFSVTIISIQLINWASTYIDATHVYVLLAIGPILGVASLVKKTTS